MNNKQPKVAILASGLSVPRHSGEPQSTGRVEVNANGVKSEVIGFSSVVIPELDKQNYQGLVEYINRPIPQTIFLEDVWHGRRTGPLSFSLKRGVAKPKAKKPRKIIYCRMCRKHKRASDNNFLVCVECNPGPSPKKVIVCKQCGMTVINIMDHLKSAHPLSASKGKGKAGKGGKGNASDAVTASVSDEVAKAQGAMDAAKEMMRDAREKEKQLSEPGEQAKKGLENAQAIERLELFEQGRSPPSNIPIRDDDGDKPHRVDDIFTPSKTSKSVMTIGPLHKNELPAGIFFSSYWARLGWLLLMFFAIQAVSVGIKMFFGFGPQFDTSSSDTAFVKTCCAPYLGKCDVYDERIHDLSILRELNELQRYNFLSCTNEWVPLDYKTFSAGWFWSIICFIINIFLDMPVIRAYISAAKIFWWAINFEFVNVIWALVTGFFKMIFMAYTLNIVVWFTLCAFYLIIVKGSRYTAFFYPHPSIKAVGRLPPTLKQWLALPMEKVKHVHLVLIQEDSRVEQQDWRGEMDRVERLAPQRFMRCHVAVEVRTDFGYRYYKDWITTLPKQWLKEQGKTLKKVTINNGLLGTALNRKTLLGSRSTPEVAIDTMLRLMSSNPHYEEDVEYMLKGGSAYRDMALVFGAIVSRNPYLDNQHF